MSIVTRKNIFGRSEHSHRQYLDQNMQFLVQIDHEKIAQVIRFIVKDLARENLYYRSCNSIQIDMTLANKVESEKTVLPLVTAGNALFHVEISCQFEVNLS